MNQVITAKLKLNLTAEQKLAVRDTALAYRDALNYTARVAFENSKSSNGARIAETCLQPPAFRIQARRTDGV